MYKLPYLEVAAQ